MRVQDHLCHGDKFHASQQAKEMAYIFDVRCHHPLMRQEYRHTTIARILLFLTLFRRSVIDDVSVKIIIFVQ